MSDIDPPRCKSCGSPFDQHPGVQSLCADLTAAQAEIERLTKEVERSKSAERRTAIACECLRQVWQCFDAAGISMGRSRQAMWLETAKDLLPYDHRFSDLADTEPLSFEEIRLAERSKAIQELVDARDVEMGFAQAAARQEG